MDNNQILFSTISFLRFPLVVCVVFIHFNIANEPFVVRGVAYGANNPEWYSLIINFFSYVLAASAVPLFYIFSGFLFFKGFKVKEQFNISLYCSKLKKRFHSLFIPYVSWNIIAILYTAILISPAFSSIFPNSGSMEHNFTLSGLLHSFFDNKHHSGLFYVVGEVSDTNNIFPADFPLWYIRDLMVVILFAPVIFYFIRKWCFYFIGILALSWFCSGILYEVNGGYGFMFITALFPFSLGGAICINKYDLRKFFEKKNIYLCFYAVLIVADLISMKQVCHMLIHKMTIVAGVITFFSLTYCFIKNKYESSGKFPQPSILSESSFFVFALHAIIMMDVGKIVMVLLKLNNNPFIMIAFYFSIPILTIVICLIIYSFLRKCFPILCSMLTGGR